MNLYIFPTYESYYITMNSKICKNRSGPSLKLPLIFRYLVNITSCDLGTTNVDVTPFFLLFHSSVYLYVQ